MRVIDADGHVLEPRVAFAHLPDDQEFPATESAEATAFRSALDTGLSIIVLGRVQ